MKTHTSITIAILLLTAVAQAKIGETIAQATTRYGPPTERRAVGEFVQERTRATYIWKRPPTHLTDRLTITVEFRNGHSFQETIEFDPKGYPKPEPFIAAAGPGPWRKGGAQGVTTNGTICAIESQPFSLILVAAPPANLPKEKRTEYEEIAAAQVELNQVTAKVAEAIVTEAQDKLAKVHWLRGVVASKFTEGLLVRPTSANFPGNVLLTGLPTEAEAVDGLDIAVRIKITGTFQYHNALGGTHTIYKVAYQSEIPTPATAAK